MKSDLTINSVLQSTEHDRDRREERGLAKSDHQRARRYGMVEPGRKGRLKYTHAGHVFIYDPRRNESITSWKLHPHRKGKAKSGTAIVDPIMIKKSSQHETKESKKLHNRLTNSLITKKDAWKSHSVFVIDMSGSMRADDVNGARCRSDGVWTVLARDFIKKQLDSKSASIYDMVSVVLMGEIARVPIRYEPLDWVLYNKLVDLREWTTVRPSGPGNYVPALEKAEQCLNYNDFGSCSLSLLFFSDGRPSDGLHKHEEIYQTMQNIASRFGRRLVISCVGMADGKEDFSVLEKMVEDASSFGCSKALFHKPGLSANSLSSIMSTLTTSLTSTKTELTELATGKSRTVRSDISRERLKAPDDVRPGPNWRTFGEFSPTMKTRAIWTWNDRVRDFAKVLDPRCVHCRCAVADSEYNVASEDNGCLCPLCQACFLCKDCMQSNQNFHDCYALAHERRNGFIVKRSIPSFGVAVKKSAFGEGAERLAFKFRFLDSTGRHFVGPKMVAKESRFVETKEEEGLTVDYLLSHRHKYHRTFARTQAIASHFASIYNKALDDVANVFGSNRFAKQLKTYPRIRFLEPMIFELEEHVETGEVKELNILVEPMIEGTYRKWNNNFGEVAEPVAPEDFGLAAEASSIGLDSIGFLLGRTLGPSEDHTAGRNSSSPSPGAFDKSMLGVIKNEGNRWNTLAAIDEESSGSDNDDEEEYHSNDEDINEETGLGGVDDFDALVATKANLVSPERAYSKIPEEDFAQAFSHYAYVRSGGRLMVVDLQGALERNEADSSCEFIFTDPAIHKRRGAFDRTLGRRLNFGRTDRGTKGIYAFFESHVCNDACRLLGLRPQRTKSVVQLEEDTDVAASRPKSVSC